MSLLTALLLCAPALPAQEPPTALDFLPADATVVFEASREPWSRLGKRTRLHAVLGMEGVQESLEPMIDALSGFDRETANGFGAATWNALAYSRLWATFPLSEIKEARMVLAMDLGPGAVLDLGAAFPEASTVTAQGVEFLTVPGLGAFRMEGRVLLATLDLDSSADDPCLAEAEYLAGRVLAGRAGAGGLGDLPGLQRLRREISSPDDVLALYLPAEALDFERLLATFPDEGLEEPFAFMETLGLHRLEGIGWTVSIDGPDLRDRSLVLLPGIGGPIWSPELAAAADLPGRAAGLPGDTAVARMAVMDLGGAMSELLRLGSEVAALEGQAWPPEGMEGYFATAQEVADALGPVMGTVLRAEELWSAFEDRSLMIGEVWVDIEEPMALDAAMQELPEEVLRLLRQGTHFQGKKFAYQVRGDRLMLVESALDPTDSRLDGTRGYAEATARYAEELASGGIVVLDYAGPEATATLVQRLRELGEDFGDPAAGLPDVRRLPGFDELVNQVGPMFGIWRLRPDGIEADYRSGLGYSATSLIGSGADLLMGLGDFASTVEQEVQSTAPEPDGF